jgi:hypothetical protein
VFALALTAAVLLHIRLLADLDKRGGNMGDEAEVLYRVLRVRDGQPLYHDYRHPPHILALYMPAFYLVPGTLSRWLAADEPQTIFLTRLYVYLAWLGVAVWLPALVRQAGGTWSHAVLAGLLWLAGGLAIHNAHAARPDALLIFFSLAAFWTYRRGWLASAALLAAAGVFHKQTGGLVWLAMLTTELVARRWRNAGTLAGVFLAATGLGLTAAHGAWGDLFWLNTVKALARPYSVERLWLVLRFAFWGGSVVWLTGLWGLRDAPAAWRWYFGFAAGWAALSAGGVGAGDNYFLEPYALACGLTALAVSGAGPRVLPLSALLVFLTGLTIGRAQPAAEWWTRCRQRATIRAQEVAAWADAVERIGARGRAVLIEDPALALQRDREPVLLNASALGALQRAGRFDDRALRQGIETGAWPVIVLTAPREAFDTVRHFPAEWLEALRGRYELDDAGEWPVLRRRYYIYRRAEPASSSSAR